MLKCTVALQIINGDKVRNKNQASPIQKYISFGLLWINISFSISSCDFCTLILLSFSVLLRILLWLYSLCKSMALLLLHHIYFCRYLFKSQCVPHSHLPPIKNVSYVKLTNFKNVCFFLLNILVYTWDEYFVALVKLFQLAYFVINVEALPLNWVKKMSKNSWKQSECHH